MSLQSVPHPILLNILNLLPHECFKVSQLAHCFNNNIKTDKEYISHNLLKKYNVLTEPHQAFNTYKCLMEHKYLELVMDCKPVICPAFSLSQIMFTDWNVVQSCISINQVMQIASGKCHVKIVNMLLQNPHVNVALYNNQAFILAATKGCIDVIKLLLLDARVNPADNDNCAIRLAATQGHVKIVKLLLADDRVNPGAKSNHAIRQAAYNNHVEIIMLLLQNRRVDPSVNGNRVLQIVAGNGHVNLVKLLLENYRVARTDCSTALKAAIYAGNVEIARFLRLYV